MTTLPTWRDLGRRARRLGLSLARGTHEVQLVSELFTSRVAERARFESWLGSRVDSIVLRTSVAAALDQLERAQSKERR